MISNTDSLVQLDVNGDLAVITINNPPVNATSQAVREGLLNCVEQADFDDELKAIIICCAGRTFVAGADISEFGKPPMEPHLPDVYKRIEASQKPVIAALHGTALGGGLELALACHYRVAKQGSKLGLPEVSLGLIPGAGGTQRLPRIIGLANALEMITSGKPVSADKAVEFGLLDKVADANPLDIALDFAASLSSSQPADAVRRSCDLEFDSTNAEQTLEGYKEKLSKRARGQEAPQRAIEAVSAATSLSFEDGLRRERELFFESKQSPQSRAMRHAFFAERSSGKVANLDKATEILDVTEVAVIGAGTMGTGIAMCFASAGYSVKLLEMSEENLQRGLNLIEERYSQSVDRGRISQDAMQANVTRIQGTCDYDSLANSDLVIEAAFESMDVKRDIFGKLDKVCKKEAILATNTSYLDVDAIASVTSRPENVLGLHFFAPAHIMKLLEVVRAEKTSDTCLATAMAVAKRIRKIAAAVGVCYGFVGNRMYSCYQREANALLLQGATPSRIDAAMRQWGMAMGPLSVTDMSGIDIGYKARNENPNPPADPLFFRAANLMVENERLGQKTSAGFYDYENGKQLDDAKSIELIRAEAGKIGIAQREIDDQEIQDRLIYALINEGAKILEEEIASRASDIDVIWLNGYGFPRWRGGPMCYADEVGLENVVARIKQFAEGEDGQNWQVSPLLERLSKEGSTLTS